MLRFIAQSIGFLGTLILFISFQMPVKRKYCFFR